MNHFTDFIKRTGLYQVYRKSVQGKRGVNFVDFINSSKFSYDEYCCFNEVYEDCFPKNTDSASGQMSKFSFDKVCSYIEMFSYFQFPEDYDETYMVFLMMFNIYYKALPIHFPNDIFKFTRYKDIDRFNFVYSLSIKRSAKQRPITIIKFFPSKLKVMITDPMTEQINTFVVEDLIQFNIDNRFIDHIESKRRKKMLQFGGYPNEHFMV
jgi:hypothetical protein